MPLRKPNKKQTIDIEVPVARARALLTSEFGDDATIEVAMRKPKGP